jgi:hypothetical protein
MLKKEKEFSQIPMLWTTCPIGIKYFQMESIIGAIRDDILLDNRTG